MPHRRDRSMTKGQRANLVTRAQLGHYKRKLLLFVLDQFDGAKWAPSIGVLARCANCSRRYVSQAIVELVRQGIVDYEDRPGEAKRVYRINYDRLATLVAADDPQSRGGRDHPDAPEARPPAHSVRDPLGGPETAPAHSVRDPAHSVPDPVHGVRDVAHVAPHKQTREEEDVLEHGVPALSVCSAAARPAALVASEAVLQRRKTLAASLRAGRLLAAEGVWAKDVAKLVRAAAAGGTDPGARVAEVIALADRRPSSERSNRPAWIAKAIGKGWK